MTVDPFIAEADPQRADPWQVWYSNGGFVEAVGNRTIPPRRGRGEKAADDFLPDALRARYSWVRLIRPSSRTSPSPLGLYRRGDGVQVVIRRSERAWYRQDADGPTNYLATPFELRAIKHPGIMRMLDDPVEHAEFVYEFYEYCPRGDLSAAIEKGHGHQLAQAVLGSIAAALLYLHGLPEPNALVHRDIKPDNILQRDDGNWIVGDLDRVTHLGEDKSVRPRSGEGIGGTPAYAPPERGVSREYDWYSLGVTLVEALTGQHPFARVLGLGVGEVPKQLGQVSRAQEYSPVEMLGGLQDVRLTNEQRERWNLLLRALLHPKPDQRWGDRQVEAFLDDSVPDPEPPTDEGPLIRGFGGYATPPELGRALAQDWDFARSAILSRFQYREFEGPYLAALGHWLRDCHWPRALPHFTDIGTKEGQTNPDIAVACVLKTLSEAADPLTVPVPDYGTVAANPESIAGLVAEAEKEHFDAAGPHTIAIENLFATKLLHYLSRDNTDPLGDIDNRWRQAFAKYEEHRRWARRQAQAERERIYAANQAVLPGDSGEHLSMFVQDAWELDGEDGATECRRAKALLLQSIVDQSTGRRMLQAITTEHPEASQLGWFSELVSDTPSRLPYAVFGQELTGQSLLFSSHRRLIGRLIDRVYQVLSRVWNRIPIHNRTRRGES